MILKWRKSDRSLKVFKAQQARWLKGTYLLKISEINPASINSKPGRPQLILRQKSERAKTRVVAEIPFYQNNDVEPLVHAATTASHKCNKLDLEMVLKETVSATTKAAKVRKLMMH